jgi:hypothetical protein
VIHSKNYIHTHYFSGINGSIGLPCIDSPTFFIPLKKSEAIKRKKEDAYELGGHSFSFVMIYLKTLKISLDFLFYA